MFVDIFEPQSNWHGLGVTLADRKSATRMITGIINVQP